MGRLTTMSAVQRKMGQGGARLALWGKLAAMYASLPSGPVSNTPQTPKHEHMTRRNRPKKRY